MKTTAARILANPSAYGVGRFPTVERARQWIAMTGEIGSAQVLMGDHDGERGVYLTASGRVLGALKRAGYEIAR